MRIIESALLTLKSIQDVFEPLCEAKGVTFAIQAQEVQPAIWIDKVRFYQIFHNILSNAVKFTPEGGKISYQEKIQQMLLMTIARHQRMQA